MNKKIIFSAMLALTLALGMVLVSCGTAPATSKKASAQLKATITGIPPEYNGKLGWISMDTGSSKNDPTVAWAMGTVSNGSLTFNILDQKTDKPYNKPGNYFVTFFVWENLDAASARGVEALYTGIIMSKTFGANTSIVFSEFTKM
jgi:hypothetical protein